jgi:hypothetical protein
MGTTPIRCVGFIPGLLVSIGRIRQLDLSSIWNLPMKDTWDISHASPIATIVPGELFTGVF